MKFQIRKKYLDILIKDGNKITLDYHQRNEVEERMVQIDVSLWEPEWLLKLKALAIKHVDDKTNKPIVRGIEFLENVKKNPSGVKITKLENAEVALRDFIKATKHRWIFCQDEDKCFNPYYVDSVKYHKQRRHSPAYVAISCKYIIGGEKKSQGIKLVSKDVRGKTLKEILELKGWVVENKIIFEQYEKELETYRKYSVSIGHQFIGSNTAFLISKSWYSSWKDTVLLSKDGISAKLIVDTDLDKEVDADYDGYYYFDGDEDEEMEEESDEELVPVLPIHLYIKCFHLYEHQEMNVHVNNMTPYAYDAKVGDKLVLPADTKDLIDIMLNGTQDLLEDIVLGKKGGIIILATGVAGVGKTLTAEVYSEIIKRPLYVVPSHQLGIGIENLEKNLQTILNRASRWRAILLIDEADVYIHERGDDIEQNAIVGIFLRVLEYYNGILFMTSNRATIIDDAIMSRATAHIRYEKPTGDELRRIWKVLSKQFEVKMSDALIGECEKQLSGMSGRDIKNLLKLTRMLSIKREKPVDMKMLQFAAKFQDFQPAK